MNAPILLLAIPLALTSFFELIVVVPYSVGGGFIFPIVALHDLDWRHYGRYFDHVPRLLLLCHASLMLAVLCLECIYRLIRTL